jgi:hypothetical protein
MSSAATLNNSTNVTIKNTSSKENNEHKMSEKTLLSTTTSNKPHVVAGKDIYLDSTADHDLKGLLESLKSQPSSLIKIADKNNKALVKIFAYIVCREYLSGAWKNIEFEDFIIERVS